MPITPKNILKCLSAIKTWSDAGTARPTVKFFSSVPYILQMFSEDDDGLACLQEMDIVGVGGASLPPGQLL